MCDGVILVFHGTKTTMASARQAIEPGCSASPIRAVLNIDINADCAYYRHYYGSNYGVSGSTTMGPVTMGTVVIPLRWHYRAAIL
jgi:hypothetical protein